MQHLRCFGAALSFGKGPLVLCGGLQKPRFFVKILDLSPILPEKAAI
jgi:hypothetical protein